MNAVVIMVIMTNLRRKEMMMKMMSRISVTYLGKPEKPMGSVMFLQAPNKHNF